MPTPENTSSGVRAALRDASWYRRPNTASKPLTYHVLAGSLSEGLGACGLLLVALDTMDRDATEAAETISPHNRCRRPGCKARWPAYPSESNPP